MPTKPIVKQLELSEDDLTDQLNKALGGVDTEDIEKIYSDSVQDFEVDTILKGRIVNVIGDDVIVDVGYKSEGIVPIEHFEPRSDAEIGAEVH